MDLGKLEEGTFVYGQSEEVVSQRGCSQSDGGAVLGVGVWEGRAYCRGRVGKYEESEGFRGGGWGSERRVRQ